MTTGQPEMKPIFAVGPDLKIYPVSVLLRYWEKESSYLSGMIKGKCVPIYKGGWAPGCNSFYAGFGTLPEAETFKELQEAVNKAG